MPVRSKLDYSVGLLCSSFLLSVFRFTGRIRGVGRNLRVRGHIWRTRQREPIMRVWAEPQRGPGAPPLVRGSWSWTLFRF